MRTKQAKKFKETTRDRHLGWINHYVNNDFGIWIECTACKKWRKNYKYSESHEVPEIWCCSMGTSDNGRKGSCEDPEENTEVEYFEYCPGSLVWARLDGYPWWPGMVDEDPDIEEYFYVDGKGTRFYNVTFLDERVTHAWIPASCLSSFLNPPPRNSCVQKQYKQNKYSSAIMKAEERANTALKMTIKDRLKKFSFVYLYKGKWPLADDFENTDEEDNPHDITDILLQEIDDLGSINTSDTDDQEFNETDENLRFLPSEKPLTEHDFNYLEKKNEIKSLNTKKHSFKTNDVHHKTKKNSETRISKSEENIAFMKPLINKKSTNSTTKKKVHSFLEKDKNSLKRSKTSKLSIKKLKAENNSLNIEVGTLENTNLKEITSEKERELIEISKQNDYEKSNSSLNISTINEKPADDTTNKEECMRVDKIIPKVNIEASEVNSNETDYHKSNNCSQFSPLSINNEVESEVNSILHIETDTIDKTDERVFQNADPKYSNDSTTEEPNNIFENKAQSLNMVDSNYSEKIDTNLSHLDECITNVINCAIEDIELPPMLIKSPKKKVKQTDLPFMSVKTHKTKTPKKVNQNGKFNSKTLRNTNETEVFSNDCNQISSNEQKASKKQIRVTFVPKDSKQNKCESDKNTTPVKKDVKLVGYDKLQQSKSFAGDKLINSSLKESKNKTKVNGSKLNGIIVNGDSSMGHNNILNAGNKIKPDFKTFKRPFKSNNLSEKKDNVTEKKQCTKEIQNEKCGTEDNSFQDLLKSSKSSSTPLYNGKVNGQVSVLEEPFANEVMKKNDETSLEADTKPNGSSKNSTYVEFTSEDKEDDLKRIVIDDEEKENFNQDINLKDKKDADDCFFYLPISDEE